MVAKKNIDMHKKIISTEKVGTYRKNNKYLTEPTKIFQKSGA